MINLLIEILNTISVSKMRLSLMAVGFILISSLEAFGIGFIGPFIYLVSSPNEVLNHPISGWIYRELEFSDPNDFITLLGVALISFFLIKSIVNWKIQTYIFRFSYEQEAKLIRLLFHEFLTAPYTYHLEKDSSYITQAIIGDLKKFSMGVLIPALTAISNITIIISLTLLLFISSPWITLFVLLTLLPIILMLSRHKEVIRQWGAEISKSNESTIRAINQALGGIKEVKVIGCNEYFEHEVDLQSDRYVEASSKNFAFKVAPRILMEAFFMTFMIGASVAILLIKGDAKSFIPVLGIFALASIRLIPAFSNLANALIVLRSSSYVANKICLNLRELNKISQEFELSNKKNLDLLYYESPSRQNLAKLYYANSDIHKAKFSKVITLEDVSYCYPKTNIRSLSNLNLEIFKGESIAFIGKSGAGKTTLMDVLLGLLIPQSGDIKVDGISIYKDLRAWQNSIGYIPQSIHLIDASIGENIALGVPKNLIDKNKLNQCIYAAQLESVISSLGEGIETKVGERGVRLSGGQRQRVGIARALYHSSEILVMDEATSALDGETETLVTDSIKALGNKKTVFVVAHRLSTIEHCDRVCLLSEGSIIKSGSYSEVMAE